MATLYFPIPPCRQLPLALIRVFAGGGTKMERAGYPQMHIVRSGYRAEVSREMAALRKHSHASRGPTEPSPMPTIHDSPSSARKVGVKPAEVFAALCSVVASYRGAMKLIRCFITTRVRWIKSSAVLWKENSYRMARW